jgi:hypothetical protein
MGLLNCKNTKHPDHCSTCFEKPIALFAVTTLSHAGFSDRYPDTGLGYKSGYIFGFPGPSHGSCIRTG